MDPPASRLSLTLPISATLCTVSWWRDRKKSGGQMIEQVIHLYDLATHFLGKPKSVSALTANLCHKKSKGYSSEDTSASIISFVGGAMALDHGQQLCHPHEVAWHVHRRLREHHR